MRASLFVIFYLTDSLWPRLSNWTTLVTMDIPRCEQYVAIGLVIPKVRKKEWYLIQRMQMKYG